MKYLETVFALLVLSTSCHQHPHDEASEDARPALSFTDWTEQSELFIELPALVRGQASPCAAHVTQLASFGAPERGRVSVILRGTGGDERFESGTPSAPGIFRPVVRPRSAGMRRLLVEVHASGVEAVHDLGEVTVFESVPASRRAIPEAPEVAGRITFLKEQQWPIEFGTAVVETRPIRPTLRTFGTLRGRDEGDLLITAPVAGRIVGAAEGFPRIGESAAEGDLLAVLSPRLEATDRASLELAVGNANLEVRFAERERERLQELRTEGAVPERRVEEASHVTEEARVALTAAQRRLDQYRRVERTAGRGAGALQIRSPFAGVVTEVLVSPGAFVEAGAPLLRVTDVSTLWLAASVPQVDIPSLGTVTGASFTLDGSDETYDVPADTLVARGARLDSRSQAIDIIFAFDNTQAHLPSGAFCSVFLATGEARNVLAVPASALVDDGGTSAVFVQVEGEAFERRIVRVGARDRGFVEIVSGIRQGEHVVTRGAWSVKLAASSGSVPAHGHSH